MSKTFYIELTDDYSEQDLAVGLLNGGLKTDVVMETAPIAGGHAFSSILIERIWNRESRAENCKCTLADCRREHRLWQELTESQQRVFTGRLIGWLGRAREDLYEMAENLPQDCFPGIKLGCE